MADRSIPVGRVPAGATPIRGVSNEAAETDSQSSYTRWITLILLTCLLIWVYWNSLRNAATYWDNPKYSHGYLIPLFTVVLLWLRRSPDIVVTPAMTTAGGILVGAGLVVVFATSMLAGTVATSLLSAVAFCGIISAIVGTFLLIGNLPAGKVTPSARLAGLALLVGGLMLRLATTYFPNVSPEMASFVPCLAGLFLMVGGWPTMRWAGPAIAFLVFMFPLPGFLDTNLLQPLQRLATQSSSYVLQTMGIPAHPEGNEIRIGDTELNVVEACSGLRMLTIFEALCVAVCLILSPPAWQWIVIIISGVPIALASNIMRITVTGLLHLAFGKDAADIFHNQAGWMMMIPALGMLYLELQFLSHLFVEDITVKTLPIGMDFRGGPRPTGTAPKRPGPGGTFVAPSPPRA